MNSIVAVSTTKKRGGRNPILSNSAVAFSMLRSLAMVCGSRNAPHRMRTTVTASVGSSTKSPARSAQFRGGGAIAVVEHLVGASNHAGIGETSLVHQLDRLGKGRRRNGEIGR